MVLEIWQERGIVPLRPRLPQNMGMAQDRADVYGHKAEQPDTQRAGDGVTEVQLLRAEEEGHRCVAHRRDPDPAYDIDPDVKVHDGDHRERGEREHPGHEAEVAI